MEVPRHVLRTYISDNRFPLVQHHLDSYDDFTDVGIPAFLRASNPFTLERDTRKVLVYIGGEEGKVTFEPPTEQDGTPLAPHTCRLENRTYSMTMRGDVLIKYMKGDKEVGRQVISNHMLGEIPLMLRSKHCYLSAMDGYEQGECKFELGGYFVVDGSEKVLLTQELLGNNMFYAGKRTRKAPKASKSGIIEGETPLNPIGDGVRYEEMTEFYTGIRTLSEDGSRGPYSHFLVLPSETQARNEDPELMEGDVLSLTGNMSRDFRVVMITLPGFRQPVPLLSVFRALGVSSDRDLYNTIFAGIPDAQRAIYDDIFYQIVQSHEAFVERQGGDFAVLSSFTRSKSKWEVLHNIHELMLTHLEKTEEDEDRGVYFRRKAYMLGHMLKMAMDVALDLRPPSDRDNMQFKRMKTSGVLMMEQFRTIVRDIARTMLDRMDRRLTYSKDQYASDDKFKELVTAETLGYFWQDWKLGADFIKGFKGAWGDRVGIAQELARPSYLAVLHHLRKTDLQIDKSASTAPPRRLYASQFGLMCPVDSPDGSDIGYKKALALFTQVSTATPVAKVRSLLFAFPHVRKIASIHPATWRPEWTRIFVNSDLMAVCTEKSEDLYATLQKARRGGEVPKSVSIAWMRLANELILYTDAGRPIRPVLQEGVREADIRKAKTWKDMVRHMDYVDASETDSLLLSLAPFHETLPSEIHMTFSMSALANMVPYSDHNPGPRNAFSIAQQKQAASWFHTNYQKRFDTIAMMAMCPQRPLSQTWAYNELVGAGGCLPYGENAMVAVTVYGGHNQEDAMIINASSVRRGMWRTSYYHSYDVVEEMSQEAMAYHTMIANVADDPEVKRKEGMDYSKLGADGIIALHSEVSPDTILVGIKAPIVNATGQVVGYRDMSVKPKRGQRGRVDAIYKYTILKESPERDAPPIPLSGVKIRIAEERVPTIGDKMASRHSQKGTIGMLMPEEDMPFSASGLRPDLIFNPHGIPTRMTVGQFLEAASNKLGLHLGSCVDATPFTTSNRIGELRVALLGAGFEPYGQEVLYNGMTGEQMEVDVFCGPIYYQRLKHMVEDKINYRDTGPRTLMTHQPTHGRSDEGGMRIGEMERDALVAYGLGKFAHESFMDRSDKAEFLFDKEAGRIDVSRDTKEMPYAMGLFTQELEAMHIDLRMRTFPESAITLPVLEENEGNEEEE